jgi:hypothetical protein
MTFDGVALLAVVALVSLGFLLFSLYEWKAADQRRRLERMVHRNLMRAGGWRA